MWGAIAIAAVGASLAVSPAKASITTYLPGDLFIGFREAGTTNTLVAKIGQASQFLPASQGGTWNGSPFNISFGVVPNTANPVLNLNADLTAVFGSDWATNLTDGTGVRWGIIGITDNALDNVPINGYAQRTAFLTRARTTAGTASTLSGGDRDGLATTFNEFANGIGGGSYLGKESTTNSSVAYIGDGTDTNNWNTKLGTSGTFGFGAATGRTITQLGTGALQGTTNSILDLWVVPNPDSINGQTVNIRTGGSFTLSSGGVLTYSAIPEPGSVVLLGVAAALLGTGRRKGRARQS